MGIPEEGAIITFSADRIEITGFNITRTQLGGSHWTGIHIINANRTDIYQNKISHCDYSIEISNSKESFIFDNVFFDSHEIEINSHCDGTYIANNSFNMSSGVRIESSDYNTVSNNSFVSSGIIHLVYSSNNIVHHNKLVNSGGIIILGSFPSSVRWNYISDTRLHTNSIHVNSNYTTISNNTIINCGSGIFISRDCHYNLVYNNIIRDCIRYGIQIAGLDTTPPSSYNEIAFNKIYNCPNYGIDLWKYTRNNTVHNNILINNHGNDSQGNDYWGDGNLWDNGKRGNFWSDYDGWDANGDGIGETEYRLSGEANATDRYPLVNATVLFNVTLFVDPNPAITDQQVTIIVNIYHFFYWEDVEIILLIDGKDQDNLITDLNGTSTYKFEWKASSRGTHEIRVVVNSVTTEEATTTIDVRSAPSDSSTSIPNLGYVLLALTTVILATYRRRSF